MLVPRDGRAVIPRGVWVLGFVSLCMDLSSEMVHALLPLYMVTVLGASTFVVGIVEGIAEATAMIVKVFSGVLSDRWRRRKPLVLLGYGMGALSKFVFPLAPSLGWIVAARFVDRVGKGIRGAPRDALIADITPPAVRGRSFGLRQALDTVGAIGGPLAALGAMVYFANDFRIVFWIAVTPAVLVVVLAAARYPWPVLAGSALWGLHMGLTQGLLAALVAATAPAYLRGTTFGIFNLASGIALLVASVLAGWLWDALGPAYTFWAGAAFTALAGAGLWLRRDLIAALGKGRVAG